MEYLRNLQVLSIENSRIVSAPNISRLRSLKLFKIDGSNVRELPAMRNLPNLKYLHVVGSDLGRIDVGVLEHLNHLVLANFTGNRINWVHPRSFLYMERLAEVNLARNEIEDPAMVGMAMRAVKTIKSLDLSENIISILDRDSFVDIVSLERLKLRSNNIRDLRKGCIRRMPRLKVIDLQDNKISSFHSDGFMDTPSLQKLILKKNDMSRINDVSFVMDSIPSLKFLDLSENNIRDLPQGGLTGYPNLERLYLNKNQIGRVSRSSLSNMESLVELNLSHNKLIGDDTVEAAFDLPQLKILGRFWCFFTE